MGRQDDVVSPAVPVPVRHVRAQPQPGLFLHVGRVLGAIAICVAVKERKVGSTKDWVRETRHINRDIVEISLLQAMNPAHTKT